MHLCALRACTVDDTGDITARSDSQLEQLDPSYARQISQFMDRRDQLQRIVVNKDAQINWQLNQPARRELELSLSSNTTTAEVQLQYLPWLPLGPTHWLSAAGLALTTTDWDPDRDIETRTRRHLKLLSDCRRSLDAAGTRSCALTTPPSHP